MNQASPQYDDSLHMMEVLGGSFVKALVDCYYAADSRNKARLLAAFPETFEKYENMFQEWKGKQS